MYRPAGVEVDRGRASREAGDQPAAAAAAAAGVSAAAPRRCAWPNLLPGPAHASRPLAVRRRDRAAEVEDMVCLSRALASLALSPGRAEKGKSEGRVARVDRLSTRHTRAKIRG